MKTYTQIKKISESYAKMMRDNFPLSFENEKLNGLLCDMTFDDEKSLFVSAVDIEKLKSHIYSQIDVEIDSISDNRPVKEIFESIGYDFYHCKDEESILNFKKYYKKNELICTFNDIKGRLEKYYVFWIVKKDIESISHQGEKRKRDDMYGTSCCSIQINKRNKSDISIKNRYNHAVNNCDATFGNNLENIHPGLSSRFNQEFGISIEKLSTLEVEGFIFKNGKYMYFNSEINNVYYGLNKIFKDGSFTFFDKDKFYLMDYILLDLENHKIIHIDTNIRDSFFDLKIEKIFIKNKGFDTDVDIEGVLTIYK